MGHSLEGLSACRGAPHGGTTRTSPPDRRAASIDAGKDRGHSDAAIVARAHCRANRYANQNHPVRRKSRQAVSGNRLPASRPDRHRRHRRPRHPDRPMLQTRPSTLVKPQHHPQSPAPQGQGRRPAFPPRQQLVQRPFRRREMPCRPAHISGIQNQGPSHQFVH